MEHVIQKLKEYKEQVDLKKRFKWSFNLSNPIFNDSERKKNQEEGSAFDQNVSLKKLLNDKYQENSESTELDFWIINDWGGIRGFKPNERNIVKIEKFKKELEKGSLTLESFNTISSLSKLASFIDLDNFVIYDSKVIYTLNWLILSCENQQKLTEKYFPIPSGRNKIIANFDMNTIINIAHLSEYVNNTSVYIPKQQAYFDFCKFVKNATKEIYGTDTKPYKLEMLLFTLADEEIFGELKEKIKITVQ